VNLSQIPENPAICCGPNPPDIPARLQIRSGFWPMGSKIHGAMPPAAALDAGD